MTTARFTIVLELRGTRYKLCKAMIGTDGSYFLTVPYHVSEKVFIGKRSVNYLRPNENAMESPQEFSVVDDDEHRLKLSHHPDGFVQISGQGIVSGRDPEGKPKGIGLMSWPLDRPTAGPATGVTIHNATAFKTAAPPGTDRDEILFHARDIYGESLEDDYLVEFYYFAPRWKRFVRKIDGHPTLMLKHPSGAVLQLRALINSDEPDVGFLGVDLWGAALHFGNDTSAFAFSSSTGNLAHNEDGQLTGDAIFVMYPAHVGATGLAPMNLIFSPRDDPAYGDGHGSPSAD